MSNVYKVNQDKSDQMQLFLINLEGVLNQIRSRFPDELGEKEVEGHLRDHLLCEMKESLRDFLHYQYDDPSLSYTDLLLEAQKAESEACDSRVTNSASTVSLKAGKIDSESSSELEALRQQGAFLCLQLSQIKNRTLS